MLHYYGGRPMYELGRRIVVDLPDGSVLNGWDLGRTPLGYYVAIDPSATNIRFLPHGSYGRIVLYDDEKISVQTGTTALYPFNLSRCADSSDNELEGKIAHALARTDFNQLYRLVRCFAKLADEFEGHYDSLRLRDPRTSPVEIVIDVREKYLDLTSSLDRSGLLRILAQNSSALRGFSLPNFDWRLAGTLGDGLLLESMAHNASLPEVVLPPDAGRSVLERLRVESLVDALGVTEAADAAARCSEWPRRLRVIAAIGKMAVGGALATANLGAGMLVGLAGALPALGVGAIAGVVGVATSAYTGFNSACDGIKDLAAAVEPAGPPNKRLQPTAPSKRKRRG